MGQGVSLQQIGGADKSQDHQRARVSRRTTQKVGLQPLPTQQLKGMPGQGGNRNSAQQNLDSGGTNAGANLVPVRSRQVYSNVSSV